MNQQPLVSIVIPVYKGANYLAEAIDSALNQTYNNIEILVVNDGSPDDGETEKVALSYGDKIRYIYKENGGVSSALNAGIREMKGEYFSWLSHDDLYEPTKIQKQVELIQNENDIILCSGKLMDEKCNPMPYRTKTLQGRFTSTELFEHFLRGYSLNGLGFLIPKHAFEQAGTFDESMRYLQDLDMWLRILMLNIHTVVCHKDLLVTTRVHAAQQTNTISDIFDVDRNALAIKHLELIKNSGNIKIKTELYLLYYKLFVKGTNMAGIKIAKKRLIESGYTPVQLFLIELPYYLRSKVIKFCRWSYNAVLRFIGKRD